MKPTNEIEKATARPWMRNGIVIFSDNPDANGQCVGRVAGGSDDEQSLADAALIVRAVNSLDAHNAVVLAAISLCNELEVSEPSQSVLNVRRKLLREALSALAHLATIRGGGK
jgi:hypothetical protein